MSLAGSSSKSFTISSFMRAVLGQWMRLKLSPGSYARAPKAFGVRFWVGRRKRPSPGRCAGGT